MWVDAQGMTQTGGRTGPLRLVSAVSLTARAGMSEFCLGWGTVRNKGQGPKVAGLVSL